MTGMSGTRVLVIAKAPVPGEAKTRLAAAIGAERAADVAAAALLDTLDVAAAASSLRPALALTGDLARAARGAELTGTIRDWQVLPQRGLSFAERLANAHADLARSGPEPVLQVGMDTPQARTTDLAAAAAALADADAVLGPAEDGGWWLLGLLDPTAARCLGEVPMSTAETGRATRRALESAGLRVATGSTLRDVDELSDADAVALECPPGSRFATTWAAIRSSGASAPR